MACIRATMARSRPGRSWMRSCEVLIGALFLFFNVDAQPVVRLDQPVGLGIDSAQHLVVFYRAGRKWPLLKPMSMTRIDSNTVLVLDKSDGRVLNGWGGGLFVMPHGLTVD